MSRFGVSPEKETALEKKMSELGIREQDIQEKFTRSGGPGGQNVNKLATCVQLKHIPTGITVKAQKDRSQGINRFLARRSLLEKFEEQVLGRKSAESKKIEKIKKQKKRRKKRSKLKMQSDNKT